MKNNSLLERAMQLKLHGIMSHWEEIKEENWVENLIVWEEKERIHRSLERRLNSSCIGRFKPLVQFDWSWPKRCDREVIDELMQLDFVAESTNVILCGPNGVGKTTIAKNIAYQAVIRGLTVLVTTAAKMLNELAQQDGNNAFQRRIKYFVRPQLLVIDEVGYLSYSNRHADLLFEIISQRYRNKPTIITTNKPFSEWNEIFPNASCVVSLIDRLVHHSEIINIEADSFRLKEATERASQRKKDRSLRKTPKKIVNNTRDNAP
jgi:DNA replication protein DnaC